MTIHEINVVTQNKISKTIHNNISRRLVNRLKNDGEVYLNGKKVTEFWHDCYPGDKLELHFKFTAKSDIPHYDIPIDILYEDQWMLIVNKQANLCTIPGVHERNKSLVNALQKKFKEDGNPTVHMVNRLDYSTSGLVIVAKSQLAKSKLDETLKANNITKKYYAITEKQLPVGKIELPIARKPDSILLREVNENGKYALTIIEDSTPFNDDKFLNTIKIITGRTHQIRVHLSHLGAPIYGDFLYGQEIENRVALHSFYLNFEHPFTNEIIEIQTEIPSDF